MKGLEGYVGQVLDEKYRLESLLGQGGMGAVYLATHLGTERYVALKLIAPQFMRNEEFVERFKREARAAGRLRHPNVVDVTDFGFTRADGERVAYLVMEYLDGCTLGDVLAEERSLPLDWVVDILEQVSSAVGEAHRQGVVHRDLKPDNIWLEPNRLGGYRVKVLDFGIAKLAEADAGAAPDSLGQAVATRTPDTRAPNQLEATDSPRRSLLYSPQHSPADLETDTLMMPGEESGVRAEARAGAEENGGRGVRDEVQDERDSARSDDARPNEADTQLFAPAQTGKVTAATTSEQEGDGTLLMEGQPTRGVVATAEELASATAAPSGLTRIGAIMGTPTYMSPEQCRGERLDARSDIYSLGIIAYQMLAGDAPFEGDMLAVMRRHKEEKPPPLRERNRKVPKRVARVVERALAKEPSERPQTADAFANSLRANTDGVAALVRRAVALYSEYFPKFLRLSLVAHIPLVLLIPLAILFAVYEKSMPLGAKIAAGTFLGLMQVASNFISASVITGMTALMVTQLQLAPLRPLQLRTAITVLRRRWRPYLWTSLGVVVRIFVGYILFLVPGVVMTVRYAVYAPVVLLEGLSKKAARTRARELASRSWRTVIGVVVLEVCIPMIVGGVIGAVTGKPPKEAHGLVVMSVSQLPALLAPLANILITPLTAIMMAMLYLKLRQMGGESLGEMLPQFETAADTRSQWQRRMRTRLTVHSGRRTGSDSGAGREA